MLRPVAATRHFNTSIFISTLIFLIFVAPVRLTMFKIALLGVILFCQVIEAGVRKKDFNVNDSVMMWIIIFVVLNFYFLVKGTLPGNFDLFMKLSTSSFISPALLAVVLILNGDIRRINIHKLLRGALNFISIYTMIYIIAHKLGIISWRVSPILGTRLNYDGGYFYYFSQHITSLFFLIPYFIAKLMSNKRYHASKKEKIIDWVTVMLSIIVVILVGRRALLVLIAATPFLIYFLMNIKSPTKILGMLAVCLIGVLVLALTLPYIAELAGLNADKFSSLASLLDFGEARTEQMRALLDNLVANNFLGAGLGVNAEGSIRSNIPGGYELTYIAQLFAYGVIGFGIVVLFYAFIFGKSMKEINRKGPYADYLLPIVVGVIILMIASFTNPYMGNFDYCWIPMFPLAFIPRKTRRVRRYADKSADVQHAS